VSGDGEAAQLGLTFYFYLAICIGDVTGVTGKWIVCFVTTLLQLGSGRIASRARRTTRLLGAVMLTLRERGSEAWYSTK
jgi:hypothetical protein